MMAPLMAPLSEAHLHSLRQATLRMVYSNGWNPAYTFDDMGGAVLAAAAAGAGLHKLAITGVRHGSLLTHLAARLAFFSYQKKRCLHKERFAWRLKH